MPTVSFISFGGDPKAAAMIAVHHSRAPTSYSLRLYIASGFEKPSAIQQKGIVPFTKGLDVIQQAQSGTGKTATFCAGVLNNLDFGE